MMNEKLKNIIQNNLEELSISDEYPLLNVKYIKELTVVKYQNTTSTIPVDYPKFKQLNHHIIAQLRMELHENLSNDQVEIWCNKILRYIEIRYAILKDNEQKYGRSNEASTLLFQQIFALFIEYYIHALDLLYLNTALKINDLDWIKSNSNLMATNVLYQLKKEQLDTILEQLAHE